MSWQTIQMSLSLILLGAVLALVVIRPRKLAGAWPAGIGALLAIVLGLVSWANLVSIFNTVWDAAATLIALFLLSEVLDSSGFFVWSALSLARVARGSSWMLYLLILLLTTSVTALLANDGAILILTPIFANLLFRLYPVGRLQLHFVFAAGFFADAMSAIFVPSNLTNIILADSNHLSFVSVAQWMVLPTLAAFAVGALAFALRFRTQLRLPYSWEKLDDPANAITDHFVFWASWAALALLIVGYVIGGEFHWPISLVAGTVSLLMLILVKLRKTRPVLTILFAAPWHILIYALGMFVVITAAFSAGTLAFLTNPLHTFAAPGSGIWANVASGGILALLSAAVNNLPATLIGVLVLRAVQAPGHLAIYAIMLGIDIGPKLTPFGSLATLLWLGILEHHHIHISWGRYIRENWWVTLLVLLAAFAGLLVSSVLWT